MLIFHGLRTFGDLIFLSFSCLKVNTRFAINLVAEDPIVVCTKRSVWSSSGGALGHPKVYLNLVRLLPSSFQLVFKITYKKGKAMQRKWQSRAHKRAKFPNSRAARGPRAAG